MTHLYGLKQLQKRMVYKDYDLQSVTQKDGYVTEHYYAFSHGNPVETKITYPEHCGHWTSFKIWYKPKGNAKWIYLDSFEVWL